MSDDGRHRFLRTRSHGLSTPGLLMNFSYPSDRLKQGAYGGNPSMCDGCVTRCRPTSSSADKAWMVSMGMITRLSTSIGKLGRWHSRAPWLCPFRLSGFSSAHGNSGRFVGITQQALKRGRRQIPWLSRHRVIGSGKDGRSYRIPKRPFSRLAQAYLLHRPTMLRVVLERGCQTFDAFGSVNIDVSLTKNL